MPPNTFSAHGIKIDSDAKRLAVAVLSGDNEAASILADEVQLQSMAARTGQGYASRYQLLVLAYAFWLREAGWKWVADPMFMPSNKPSWIPSIEEHTAILSQSEIGDLMHERARPKLKDWAEIQRLERELLELVRQSGGLLIPAGDEEKGEDK